MSQFGQDRSLDIDSRSCMVDSNNANRMTTTESKNSAIETGRAFAKEKYPSAEMAFLGGSWANDTAHADSDLDVVYRHTK